MQTTPNQHEQTAPLLAPPRATQSRLLSSCLLAGALALLVGAIRGTAAIAPTATTPLTPLLRLADIALVLLALALAWSLGQRLLLILRVEANGAEGIALALGLGVGLWAFVAVLLGLVGLYRPPVLLALALANLALAWPNLLCLPTLARQAGTAARESLRAAPRGTAGLLTLLILAIGAALLGALTPPHHFDALAYHLAAPQRFLQTGRIAPLPDVLFGNLPLGMELLFGLGLAYGSDTFAQVLHLAFGGLTALTLWALARRYFDAATAWLACAIFLATPLVIVWSRVANIDLPLAAFLLLALLALLRAGDRELDAPSATRWALLAGFFCGTALATKYQALFAVPLIGLLLACDAARARQGWRVALARSAAFWAATLLIAAPWYLKNWLVLGNPLWPLFFGGRDFDPLAVQLTGYFADGMTISPRTPLGYLLLPLAAYLQGSIEQRLVILSPLFPLTLAAPWLPRRRAVAYPLLVSTVLFVGWSQGFQELRYLLPLCAPLSLVAAAVLRRWSLPRRLALPGLYLAALLTLGLTILHVGADRPLAVTLGQESRDTYLRQSLTTGATYRATQFLGGILQPGERVRFFNDAQVYYVPYATEPDHLDLALIALLERHPQPSDALAALQADGVTYLLVNEANIRYRSRFDPDRRLQDARARLATLTPSLTLVYSDGPPNRPTIVIYRVPPR